MSEKPSKSGAEKPEGKETSSPPKKDLKELLKTSKRKGYSTKGQQGLIEFDYPDKKK